MKLITFSDGVSISVTCKTSLTDETNLSENFLVSDIDGIAGSKEIKLFYWLTKGIPYSLHEFIFFCINNNLSLTIRSAVGVFEENYGVSTTTTTTTHAPTTTTTTHAPTTTTTTT